MKNTNIISLTLYQSNISIITNIIQDEKLFYRFIPDGNKLSFFFNFSCLIIVYYCIHAVVVCTYMYLFIIESRLVICIHMSTYVYTVGLY